VKNVLFIHKNYRIRNHFAINCLFDRLHVVYANRVDTIRHARDLYNILSRDNVDKRKNVTLVINGKKKRDKIDLLKLHIERQQLLTFVRV